MSLFHILLADRFIPPPPTSFDVILFNTESTAHARVSTRQAALEAVSSPGVDRAFSVSFWMAPHNINEMTLTQRICGVMETAATRTQWLVAIVPQSQSTFNQCLQFALFVSDMSANIQILSSERVWRSRWTHVVCTYTGSEVNTGLKIYINGFEDTTATKTGAGTYTGAGDDPDYRMQISAVNAALGQYTGRLRDLAIWNAALSDAEVLELFNDDYPVDVTTVSFYASKIVAFWPLHLASNLTSPQGAGAFNFTSPTGISDTFYPIASSYPFIGQCNVIPGNTRYVSFGSVYRESSTVWRTYQRSGTTHLANGKIVKIVADVSGYQPVFTGPIDVITNALDIRTAQAAVIDGSVYIFGTLYNTGTATFTDNVYWVSTDGEVGETFGSPISISSLLPSVQANTFAKIIQGPQPGEYMVPIYGLDGATYWGGYLKRSTLGVWSYVSMFSGATPFTETSILNCGGGNFIAVSRRESGGNGLYFMSSTDGDAAVWSSHVATGIGTGVTMADLCLTAGGKVCLIFGDRGNDQIAISHSNEVAALLADPTDWETPTSVFLDYNLTSLPLFYPVIDAFGALGAAFWSSEFSSSRADLFFAYGQIEY